MEIKKIAVLTLEEVRLAIAQEIARGYKTDSIEIIVDALLGDGMIIPSQLEKEDLLEYYGDWNLGKKLLECINSPVDEHPVNQIVLIDEDDRYVPLYDAGMPAEEK